jgi:group I intron endonuclease
MPKRARRPRVTCIYSITCLANGKIYIGSSRDVSSRWNSHIYNMENYKHSIPEMIVDWHRYGTKNFSFTILRYVEVGDIRKVEQECMDQVDAKKLYNKRRAKVRAK